MRRVFIAPLLQLEALELNSDELTFFSDYDTRYAKAVATLSRSNVREGSQKDWWVVPDTFGAQPTPLAAAPRIRLSDQSDGAVLSAIALAARHIRSKSLTAQTAQEIAGRLTGNSTFRTGPGGIAADRENSITIFPPATVKAELNKVCSWVVESELLPGIFRASVAHAALCLLHPFQDGNGRFSRLMAAAILTSAHHTQVADVPRLTPFFYANAAALSGHFRLFASTINPWPLLHYHAAIITRAAEAAAAASCNQAAGDLKP